MSKTKQLIDLIIKTNIENMDRPVVPVWFSPIANLAEEVLEESQEAKQKAKEELCNIVFDSLDEMSEPASGDYAITILEEFNEKVKPLLEVIYEL